MVVFFYIASMERSKKEKWKDLFWGLLFVVWYVTTLTFPAFNMNDIESRKSFVVAFIAPIVFLIMVLVRFMSTKKSSPNLLTFFFIPDAKITAEFSLQDKITSNGIGWIGILIAPALGSYSCEKFINSSTLQTLYLIGIIPAIAAGFFYMVWFWNKNEDDLPLAGKWFYAVCCGLLSWWTWAVLLNLIELLSKESWVFFTMPEKLKWLFGI